MTHKKILGLAFALTLANYSSAVAAAEPEIITTPSEPTLEEQEFQVHEHYPTWRLKTYIAHEHRTDSDGRFLGDDNRVDTIEITDPASGHVLQTLEVREYGGPIWTVCEKDYNFDGFQDIELFLGTVSLGNDIHKIWLFDPTDKLFHYHQTLSDMSNIEADAISKHLTSSYRCCGGQEEEFYTYQWKGTTLELIEQVTTHGLDPQPHHLKAPADCPNPTWVIQVTKKKNAKGQWGKSKSKRSLFSCS